MSIRKTSVSGTFYPSSKDEINKYIDHFDKVLDDSDFNINYDFIPRAIISPHAGYVYSGFTANVLFRTIKNKINPKRIVVIGPSHKFGFDGASISLYDNYDTPFGELNIDIDYAHKLEKKYDFLDFLDDVHQEHSTETQMPFLKYYFPNVQVVEIIYSKCDYHNIIQIIDEVLKDEDSFVVISTDLSHFYNLQDAHKLDNICLKAIKNLDLDLLDQGCEACGLIGIKAIVEYAKNNDMKSQLLDYRTSADASGDTTRVVGYSSFVLGD